MTPSSDPQRPPHPRPESRRPTARSGSRPRSLALLVFLAALLLGGCAVDLGGPGGNGGNGDDPALRVQPDTVTLDGRVGATFSGTITVQNTGGGTLSYEVSSNRSWVQVTPASGTVAAGESEELELSATCDAAGDATATLTVDAGSAGEETVAVERSCEEDQQPPQELPDSSFLVAEANADATSSFQLSNDTDAPLPFTIAGTVPEWLQVTPASGTIPPQGSTEVTLSQTCPGSKQVQRAELRVDFQGAADRTVEVFRVCVPPAPGAFNIDLGFSGPGFNVRAVESFVDAAARWEAVVTDDLPQRSVPQNLDTADCFPDGEGPQRAGLTVDDLYIDARIVPIDGPISGGGGVVGSAGPCLLRSAPEGELPYYGVMRFDSEDVPDLQADGRFDPTIRHEMGHVLGIGTLWDDFDLVEYTADPPQDNNGNPVPCRLASAFQDPPVFVGASAKAAFQTLGGAGDVPVEEEGGAGTKCGHWDEGFFEDELMTGFLENQGGNPLSILTIASLEDLGYAVDRSEADDYDYPPGCSPDCSDSNLVAGQRGFPLAQHEEFIVPLARVAPDGSVEWLRERPTR